MNGIYRFVITCSTGILFLGVCCDAWTAQWLISSSSGVLRDYTQGGGPAANPRSISPAIVNSIVTGIDFAADGNLYALTTFSDNRLYRVQPSTGASTIVGSTGLTQVIEGDLGFDPSTGALYGLYNPGGGGNQFFTLNTTTGAATVIGGIPSDDPSGLAFDNSGQMWVIESNVNTTGMPQLLKVNKSNGSIISTMSTGLTLASQAILGADFDPTTNQLYMAIGNGNFYHVSTATGLATLIGAHGVTDPSGLAFVPVPEPGLVTLLAVGGVALAYGFPRRRAVR